MQKIQNRFKIVANERISPGFCRLRLDAKAVAAAARPGQFIHIKVSQGLLPFFRRPFSIHRAKKHLEILYEVLGEGTQALVLRKPGEYLDVLGPLGNHFNLPPKGTRQVVMVAGGVGFLVIAATLVVFMPEQHYQPIPRGDRSRARHMGDTLTAGIRTVRGRPVLVTILLITFLGAAASETFDRLWELHILNNFSFPAVVDLPPIVWFGLISVIGLLVSIGVAEVARRRVDTDSHLATARALLGMNGALLVGMAVFALAGRFEFAVAGYLLARVMRRVTAPISTAWINQSLTPHVRATVMSLNAQTDAVGQIAGGPVLGALAVTAGTPLVMLIAAGFIVPSLLLYVRTIRLHGRDIVGDEHVADDSNPDGG